MAILEGPGSRYFEIVPDPRVKGFNVLAEFGFSFSAGQRYVFLRCWTFEQLHEALERYERG